eukprot:g19633.t1
MKILQGMVQTACNNQQEEHGLGKPLKKQMKQESANQMAYRAYLGELSRASPVMKIIPGDIATSKREA